MLCSVRSKRFSPPQHISTLHSCSHHVTLLLRTKMLLSYLKMPKETDTLLTRMADTSPDTTRALSPPISPTGGGHHSPWSSSPRNSSQQGRASPKSSPPNQSRHTRGQSSGGSNYFGSNRTYEPIGDGNIHSGGDVESGRRVGGREALNDFETSLPLRLDYEACLAYLLLPPVGGVLLLILEWKSDYVRYVKTL